MMPGVNDAGMEGAANTNIEMMKAALNLKESDDESIVSSKGGSDSGEEERDLLKALAQRATDPYIKARKAKGPFVYIKPRLRPGRHIYVEEEIEKTQDAYLEEQLRQKLKGARYRVTGLVKFDKHGQAKGFEVQEVAAAISSAVRAVLQEERAATGGSLGGQHSSQQEQLDTEFANKVAERTAWSDPVFEEAVRAARSEAFTASTVSPYQPQAPINRKPPTTASPSAQPLTGPPTASSVMPPPPTSPPAQPFTGPSTAQGWPPASSSPGQFPSPYPFQEPSASPDQLSSSHPLHHLQQPPPPPTSGWDGLQQHPSGTPGTPTPSIHRQRPLAPPAAGWDGAQQPFPGTASHSIRLQQSPPTSATPTWGGPHQGPQILNLEQSGPPTSSPEASFSASPSFAPLPRSPAQQQQQQRQPEGWEGYSQPAGHTSHPTSPFLQQQQQQGVVEQHTHVPLGSMHQQDISSGPYLQQQGWTQGEGYGTWSVERDSRERDDGRRYSEPDTRGFPEEVRDFDHSRGHRGYDREGRGAHYHDDGRAHGRDRHERHKHSRGGQERRSSSSSRERHRQRRHHRHHHQGRRYRYQADGMRHGSREVDGMRVRAEDKGRYGRGDEPRGHQHSSRREGKEYEEERHCAKGDSRRGEHRVGGKEGHRGHRSKHEQNDWHRQPESRHRDDSGAQSRDAYHSRSKDAYSRDARYSRSKDAHRHSQPNTSTQAPRTAATNTSKARAKKQQSESETDSQASKDSGFPGLEAVLQSEEAAAFLRPAVSSASEADPNPEAPPRNPAEIKAKLHGDPKGRLMREARKERWTSSDDDGGFCEYVRQSRTPE